MTNRHAIRLAAIPALLFVLAVPGFSRADVTVERFTKSGGIAGVGAHEATVVSKISGARKREATSMKLTGGLGGFFGKLAGDMGTDVITDIPQDAVRTLDHKKKSYTQQPITLPKQKSDGNAKGEGADDGKEEKPGTRVIRNEITVKETGEKKTINGFSCARYIVTWLIETEDVETKERSKMTMTNDLWNTPETRQTEALRKAELDFSVAYFKKLGIPGVQENPEKFGMAALAGMFGKDDKAVQDKFREFQEKLSKVKGYPIVTAIRWEVDGQGSRRAGGEKAETAERPEGLAGLLEGFGKGMGASKPAEKPKGEAGGGNVLFDAYSEIRKIEVSSVPSSEFEVPKGYKLTK